VTISTRKPLPLHVQPARKRCSICGEISYSVGGAHPQCCVEQADSRRLGLTPGRRGRRTGVCGVAREATSERRAHE
jgi:hypothetical protein